MICNTCHGAGFLLAPYTGPRPCPRCEGSGTDHCCDGDQPSARDAAEQQREADRLIAVFAKRQESE